MSDRFALLRRLETIAALLGRDVDLGLERVLRVYAALGSPRPGARVITVAGTNGKGSCAHFAARLATGLGLTTGLYTSPHLLHFNERIVVNGRPVADSALLAALDAVEDARGPVRLSFFEYLTLAAFWLLARERPDVAVLEVGLGGRLDAVNVVDPDVAVVTSIALDHQAWLGSDREAIGREKAGIFRAGRPAICVDPRPPASVEASARASGARFFAQDRGFSLHQTGNSWALEMAETRWSDLPLPGAMPPASFAAAILALHLAGFSAGSRTVRDCLSGWVLPGRLQRVTGKPQWVFDVAHNPAAASLLGDFLRATPVAGRTRAIIGLQRDKDARGFCAALAEVVDEMIAVDLPAPRGLAGQELQLLAADQIGMVSRSVAGACARVRARSGPDDRIVACGSFQIVGPALGWLGLYSRRLEGV